MSKEVTFMRKDLFSEEEMNTAIEYIAPLFEGEGEKFKEKIKEDQAFIEGKRFTYIDHPEVGKRYRLMGNCIGPVIYVRDILPLEK